MPPQVWSSCISFITNVHKKTDSNYFVYWLLKLIQLMRFQLILLTCCSVSLSGRAKCQTPDCHCTQRLLFCLTNTGASPPSLSLTISALARSSANHVSCPARPATDDEKINSNFVHSQCGVAVYKKLFVENKNFWNALLRTLSREELPQHHAKTTQWIIFRDSGEKVQAEGRTEVVVSFLSHYPGLSYFCSQRSEPVISERVMKNVD